MRSSAKPLALEELTCTCRGCPTEWEGRLADGLRVFAAYRCGALRLGLGKTRDEAIENAFVLWRGRDPLAGFMATGTMLRLTGLEKT